MAEIGLDGASVAAVVGELEPTGMTQHVRMHEEREFRSHARPGNHALICAGALQVRPSNRLSYNVGSQTTAKRNVYAASKPPIGARSGAFSVRRKRHRI